MLLAKRFGLPTLVAHLSAATVVLLLELHVLDRQLLAQVGALLVVALTSSRLMASKSGAATGDAVIFINPIFY